MAFQADKPVPAAIGRVVFTVDDVDGVAVPSLSIRGEYKSASGEVLFSRFPSEALIIAELTPQERTGLLSIMGKFRAAFVASLA